jgi:hypothetical protein
MLEPGSVNIVAQLEIESNKTTVENARILLWSETVLWRLSVGKKGARYGVCWEHCMTPPLLVIRSTFNIRGGASFVWILMDTSSFEFFGWASEIGNTCNTRVFFNPSVARHLFEFVFFTQIYATNELLVICDSISCTDAYFSAEDAIMNGGYMDKVRGRGRCCALTDLKLVFIKEVSRIARDHKDDMLRMLGRDDGVYIFFWKRILQSPWKVVTTSRGKNMFACTGTANRICFNLLDKSPLDWIKDKNNVPAMEGGDLIRITKDQEKLVWDIAIRKHTVYCALENGLVSDEQASNAMFVGTMVFCFFDWINDDSPIDMLCGINTLLCGSLKDFMSGSPCNSVT